ncbi:hypothetical protein AXA44_34520 [Rhodococcus sp. SC4]|nr:hypothetical protein AXA44_34520 [Rhodococcus sp. SC4]
MTLRELARAADLPKSTTHRLASTLVELGGLIRVEDGYRLGARMYAIGARSWEATLHHAAVQHMEQLHRLSRQTLHLAVLTGPDVLYLEKIAAKGSPPSPASVAGRLPAHLTGVGKVLMAFSDPDSVELILSRPLQRRTNHSMTEPAVLRRDLATIRRTGIAQDNAEAADNLRCLAVPIWHVGRAAAALSLSFPSSVTSFQALENSLRAAATAISRSLDAQSRQIVA